MISRLELSRVIDTQTQEIFRNAYKEEARYRDTAVLIEFGKELINKFTGIEFSGPDLTFKNHLDFGITKNDEAIFHIKYGRLLTPTSQEEILTITRNEIERINFTTRKYSDSRLAGYIEYYDDAPGFESAKYWDFNQNLQEARRLLNAFKELS